MELLFKNKVKAGNSVSWDADPEIITDRIMDKDDKEEIRFYRFLHLWLQRKYLIEQRRTLLKNSNFFFQNTNEKLLLSFSILFIAAIFIKFRL